MVEQSILIYDANNTGGDAEKARAIIKSLSLPKNEKIVAFIIGDKHTPREIVNILKDELNLLSLTEISEEFEEAILGFSIGRILENWKDTPFQKNIYLVSSDKRLACILVPMIEAGYNLTIIGFNVNLTKYPNGQLEKTKRVDLAKLFPKDVKVPTNGFQFDCNVYPYYYGSELTEGIPAFLRAITFPERSKSPLPKLIPLPLLPEEITIGGNPNKVDLPLAYWDQKLWVRGKKMKYALSLYSPHAFFGKKLSGWYIRSAKGHRKERGLSINNKKIDAACGNVSINSGDIIRLSGFCFEFCQSLEEKTEISGLNNRTMPDLLEFIERRIHNEIIIFLKDKAKTAGADWFSLIPSEILDECENRRKGGGNKNEPLSNFLFIKEESDIVKTYWEEIKAINFFKAWSSKTQWDRAIGALIFVRNKVAHPIRGKITEKEKLFIENLANYLSIKT
jgi:hypothetical protein